MGERISRRRILGMAAAAAPGLNWMFRLNGDGRIVVAVTADGETWSPEVFTETEARAAANVCEAIIPRTDTPGARDARVHEYIDLELSVNSAGDQSRFKEGLAWLNERCKAAHGHGLDEAGDDEVAALLEPLSDEHDSHGEKLAPGARFFREVKRRTIFGYYTSREGWVEELGRRDHAGMEQWRGCTHGGH